MSEEFVVSMVFRGNDQMSRPASEMSRALKGLTADNRAVTQSSQDAGRGMSGFGNALKGAFAVFSVNTIKNFAEDFNDLGTQVRQADRMFENFGGNADVLADLRQETRGVVDDFTLMRGAADFMNLGITRTMDEASKLIGMIEAVKKPTEETSAALENFSLLIANQSYLRLDTFGISSAQVRDRVQELKDTLNMSSEAAFTQATMEALEGKVTSLGDAAYASDTALNRFGTTMTNVSNDAALLFADTLERGLVALEQLNILASTGNLGALFGGEIVNPNVETQAFARGQVAADAFLQGYTGEIDPQYIRDYIQRLSAEVEKQMAAGGGSMLWDAQIDNLMREAVDLPTLSAESPGYADLLSATDFYYGQLNSMQQAAALNERNLRLEQERLDIARNTYDFRERERRLQEAAVREQQRTYTLRMGDALFSQMEDLYTGGLLNQGSLGGITLFTDEQALQADAIRNEIDALATELKGLNDTDIISDTELEGAKQLASQAGDFANSIERGARELENMSLSGIFGQTGGGLMGEVGGLFLAEIRNSGVEGDALQEITDAIGLRSGMETEASLTFRDEILPMLTDIYAQFGTDAAVAAYAAYSEGIANATLSGRNLTPDMQMAMTGFQRTDGGGQSFTVENGDTPLGVAQRYGLTLDQISAATGWEQGKAWTFQPGEYSTGGGVERIAEMATAAESMAINAPVAADAFSQMNSDVGVLQTGVDGVKSTLDDITNTVHRVVVDLDVRYPGILDAILGGGSNLSTRESISQATRANGGRTPGSDTRTRTLER